MEKFIYVFDTISRDNLVSSGYKLLKSDDKSNIYIFINTNNANFALGNEKYVLSNQLTF